MSRIGFEPPDHPEWEPADDESVPSHVGEIGQLTTTTEETTDDARDDGEWLFRHHIYVAIQLGPFALVIGRPE
jgi:hypothetical protein